MTCIDYHTKYTLTAVNKGDQEWIVGSPLKGCIELEFVLAWATSS